MNGLRKIVHASCTFHKDYFTCYTRDWNSNWGIYFGITCGKYSMELLSDFVVKIEIFEISSMNFRTI